jgi:hypothetical protein
MIQPWYGAHIERDGAYRVDCPSLYDVYNNSNRGDIGDRFRISPVQTVLKCPVVKQYQAVINAVDVQRKHTIFVNWTSTRVNVEYMLAELGEYAHVIDGFRRKGPSTQNSTNKRFK